MLILHKVKTFASLNFRRKKYLIEAFIYLAWARIIKNKQFSKIYRKLGDYMEETELNVKLNDTQKEILMSISDAINIMSNYTFWESQCLVKAIAGMKMLHRRKIESTLYLGTAKDVYGQMIAHAWLRSGPFYITGLEGMEKFTVVGKFAKRIDG